MKKQMGASLIEAMVAVLIVGFGLLGVGAMQSRAIAMNQSAYYRSVAADLAADLAERVRALRSPFMAGADIIVPPPLPPDFSQCELNADLELVCAPQSNERIHFGPRVNEEMGQWYSVLRSQLPAGSSFGLEIIPGGTSGFLRYTLTLTWLDDRLANTNERYEVVIE
jgi:type IV pilus assembly protein PilV